MSVSVNRTPRYVLGVGMFLLAFVVFEGLIFGEHQPLFWSDLVDRLAPTGTIVTFLVFLVLVALVVGVAALGVLVLVKFVVPRPPGAGRAVLQTVIAFAVVFSMSIALRAVAPLLLSAVSLFSLEAPQS